MWDVIIVGAGAAGLVAAYDLTKAGKHVLILEASDHFGGRANTIKPTGFSQPIEAGAEFVHGNVPISLSLIHKARLPYEPMSGKPYTLKKGMLLKEEGDSMYWDTFMEKLSELEEDITLSDFLQLHFSSDKYAELRESAIQFASGFDAADPKKVSAVSLKKEWSKNEDEMQLRLKGGYYSLMHFLMEASNNLHGTLKLLHAVSLVDYRGKEVIVTCKNGLSFSALKVLITIPLGIWQQKNAAYGIQYLPALLEKQKAACEMGFGNVIKIIMEFTDGFWEYNSNAMPGAGFIFTDAFIPTWWTQKPLGLPLLTGWLAGPPADACALLSNDEITARAIQSLSYIFNLNHKTIQEKLIACHVTNWGKIPYALGGYSYETLQSAKSKQIVMHPVNNKLFFAGEALYDGPHTGTVEAAFNSGRRAASEMI